jgi:hypothetical protein
MSLLKEEKVAVLPFGQKEKEVPFPLRARLPTFPVTLSNQ